jgi:proteic killer suppression protein
MKVIFSNKLKYLNDETETIRKHGYDNAMKIQNCLDTLKFSKNLFEIFDVHLFRCHLLKGKLKGCYALDLKHPQRMVIKPANDPLPMKANKEIDTSKVNEIEIVQIGDYHG